MDMDTGQYLCVHVSDKEQPSFFGIKPIFLSLCLHWPPADPGAVCSAVLLSLSLHGLFEEKTKTKPRTKPINFPASKAAASEACMWWAMYNHGWGPQLWPSSSVSLVLKVIIWVSKWKWQHIWSTCPRGADLKMELWQDSWARWQMPEQLGSELHVQGFAQCLWHITEAQKTMFIGRMKSKSKQCANLVRETTQGQRCLVSKTEREA